MKSDYLRIEKCGPPYFWEPYSPMQPTLFLGTEKSDEETEHEENEINRMYFREKK